MEPLTVADLSGDLPRPGVLCTLAAVVGSAPQAPGAKLWVWTGGLKGTIGGGTFEFQVAAHARKLLEDGSTGATMKEFVLCRDMGQCCGGRVTVLFEPCARRRAVHIYGAGHVGRALAEVLSGLDLDVVVSDSRAEWADPAAFPAGVRVLKADPGKLAAAAGYGPFDAVCVMTHDHDLDLRCVTVLLGGKAGYLGLIGSAHKARVFRSRLPAALRPVWDERLRCPIGRKLPTKSPRAIAITIASQLLEEWVYRRLPAEAATR